MKISKYVRQFFFLSIKFYPKSFIVVIVEGVISRGRNHHIENLQNNFQNSTF